MGNHGPHHLFLGQTQLHCWGIGCDDDIVDLLSRRFNLSCTPPPSSSSTSPSCATIHGIELPCAIHPTANLGCHQVGAILQGVSVSCSSRTWSRSPRISDPLVCSK
ncbi:uncharacterized protein LOC120657326 [Panicum virgatum]|uniref:uncharacterized protein LOC120657326 n=1 Tax=Panicum virgatum TaxID=38727 RepID=UPI0019D57164|nr:uncharacterized protein LOC120657326 [Panicum virgatum]